MEASIPARQTLSTIQAPTPAIEGTPIADLDGVHVRLGTREVLRGLNLSLHQGEIFALLGRNGTGKTTLMRLLTGQLRPTSGNVRVFGGDPGRDAATRRMMSLVPQDIALYPRLTVRENLEIMAGMAGLSKRETPLRVEEVLALVQVEDRQGDLIDHLSGGYKRRANIAAALLTRPKLLLLDEPTVGVDVEARLSLLRTLRRLRDGGTSILLTTHDLDEARSQADRVGILAFGQMVEEGPVADILRRMFGDSREVVVTLTREPGDSVKSSLGRLGLAPTANPLEWTSWSTGVEGFASLPASLRRHGIDLHEIRVREPGLEHVLAHVEGGQP
ncbi:ABC-2 type transport system ATP-binding protein [Microvirga lupini]|uniref:ABC-2 type transport system ATP-binding protein n=1 Tax=Microvirga lupini TaxID=420324 RepID=A0A7W4YWF2_9HYPH|nr:ABC transporter ATP-binding protein [Microvirga lupini]MBB3019400.1 ABC-2 type transport system ATP-binding protein [Microvirga lupini]